LKAARFGDTWQSRGVKINHTRPNVLGLYTFDTPGEAMDAALRVDHDKIPAVATCQYVARFSQRIGKGPAAVGAAPDIRDRRLYRLDTEAGSLGLKHFGVGRRALGPFLASAFDMRALHPRVPEFAFKLASDLLMFPIAVAVADHAHALKVDPAPYNMAVLAQAISAISFMMDHHHARLTQKTERTFQPVDRVRPLLVRQSLVRRCVDGGMIEGTLCPRAECNGFHFPKRTVQVVRGDAAQFVNFIALIGFGAGQVFGDARGPGAGCAFNDHGPAS
jgi:hypothetical protein